MDKELLLLAVGLNKVSRDTLTLVSIHSRALSKGPVTVPSVSSTALFLNFGNVFERVLVVMGVQQLD
jgi:hypothetical protein